MGQKVDIIKLNFPPGYLSFLRLDSWEFKYAISRSTLTGFNSQLTLTFFKKSKITTVFPLQGLQPVQRADVRGPLVPRPRLPLSGRRPQRPFRRGDGRLRGGGQGVVRALFLSLF